MYQHLAEMQTVNLTGMITHHAH